MSFNGSLRMSRSSPVSSNDLILGAQGGFGRRWAIANSKKVKNIWMRVAEEEGGKLTFTTAAALIGAALGGVGIAAMGGVFGMPLALLLAPIGYLFGGRLDTRGWTKGLLSGFKGSEETTDIAATDQQSGPELESMAELLAHLLAREGQAEAKVVGLERNLSELVARCERNEGATRELETRVSSLEEKIASLEAKVSESQSSFVALKRQVQYLTWVGSGLVIVVAATALWLLLKR